MKPSNTALALLKQWEGCRLKAYQDQKGIWTCGYGATGYNIGPTTQWTQEQAENDLLLRLGGIGSQVTAACGLRVNQNQFDALCCMAYNIGISALRGSDVVRYVNLGQYQKAADSILNWDHITIAGVKTVNQGLLNRRTAERALFLSPQNRRE